MAQTIIELLIVLVAAKIAAEVSERMGIPAVLGEIAAGMLIGPSALGLIHRTEFSMEFLALIGQLGVILLLLQVGMEMDLRELGRVGKASLAVALAGIVLPFAGGWGLLSLQGESTITAIFLGAALTATSVGITARAFGDNRALATVESRVVIGAAVADDVLGLIILTVVARVAEKGSIELGPVLTVTGVALGFLIITTVIGLALAPPLFAFIQRNARAGGTMIALALAFTLLFAEAAEAAKLAPIVGAFVAGLALSRSRQSERIQRDLAPLSHIFVPIFFLEIGARADISAMTKPSVLVIAAVMCVVAIAGKLAAGWFAVGTSSDRLLVGIGMIPRGEVGLIFATIGLQAGVLDADLYAALILVVLVTTVITPPLLKWRIGVVRARSAAERAAAQVRPPGGWLAVVDDELVLRGVPSDAEALHVALTAARLASDATPGQGLLDWTSNTRFDEVVWDPESHEGFAELLRTGTARSWRFLNAVGVLDAVLPEIADAVTRRRTDAGELDPGRIYRWGTLERLAALTRPGSVDRAVRNQYVLVEDHDLLLLAALTIDVADGAEEPGEVSRSLATRVGRTVADQEILAGLVTDAALLRAAATRIGALDEDHVLPLAAHIETSQRARILYLLGIALADLGEVQRSRLDALHDQLQDLLNDPDLADGGMTELVRGRRTVAIDLTGDIHDARRIATAPRSLVLSCPPEELAQRVALLDTGAPARGFLRVSVTPSSTSLNGWSGDLWRVDVATRDQAGLLAQITGALADAGLAVLDASVASWADKAVLDSFVVQSRTTPDAAALETTIRTWLGRALRADPIEDIRLDFDNDGSPWHTLCTLDGSDREGLLHAICTAFAANGVRVEAARVHTDGGRAKDRFALTTRSGAKLDDEDVQGVLESIRVGVTGNPRRTAAALRRLFA